VELPQSERENLVEELDEYLEAVSSPEAEAVVRYVIELLETVADEIGIDDIVLTLEDEGALDDSLASALEAEMESNAEFEYTGEEIVSLLERLCSIEWGDEDEDEDDDDEDDDDFEL